MNFSDSPLVWHLPSTFTTKILQKKIEPPRRFSCILNTVIDVPVSCREPEDYTLMANIYVLLKSKSDIGHEDYSPISTLCDGKPTVPLTGKMKSPCAPSNEINGATPTAPLVQFTGIFSCFCTAPKTAKYGKVMFTVVSVCPRSGVPVQDPSPTPYRVLALDLPPRLCTGPLSNYDTFKLVHSAAQTVGKRAVSILFKCILFFSSFHCN